MQAQAGCTEYNAFVVRADCIVHFRRKYLKGLLSIPCDGRGARRPLGQSSRESVGPAALHILVTAISGGYLRSSTSPQFFDVPDVVRFLRDAVYEQEDCERVHAACDRMEEFEARNWYNYTARVRLTFPQYWVSTFLKAWIMSASSSEVRHEGMDMIMLRSKRPSATGQVPFSYRISEPAFSRRLQGKPSLSTLRRMTRLTTL